MAVFLRKPGPQGDPRNDLDRHRGRNGRPVRMGPFRHGALDGHAPVGRPPAHDAAPAPGRDRADLPLPPGGAISILCARGPDHRIYLRSGRRRDLRLVPLQKHPAHRHPIGPDLSIAVLLPKDGSTWRWNCVRR